MNILILMTSYKWLLALREELVDGLLSSGYGISILGPFDGNEKFLSKRDVIATTWRCSAGAPASWPT